MQYRVEERMIKNIRTVAISVLSIERKGTSVGGVRRGRRSKGWYTLQRKKCTKKTRGS